jgi:hypothetical protein
MPGSEHTRLAPAALRTALALTSAAERTKAGPWDGWLVRQGHGGTDPRPKPAGADGRRPPAAVISALRVLVRATDTCRISDLLAPLLLVYLARNLWALARGEQA